MSKEELIKKITGSLPEGESFFGAAPLPLGMFLVASKRENDDAPFVLRGFYMPKGVLTDDFVGITDETTLDISMRSFCASVRGQLFFRYGVQ